MYIPPELKAVPNWVFWKLETTEKGKLTKIPYQASGAKASSTDSKTWKFYDDLEVDYNQKFDGYGFCAGEKADRFVLVDLDHCIDHDGNIEPWADDIIKFMDSYTEISPSGNGIHIICGGHWDVSGKKTTCAEMYGYARYFTYTGDVYKDKKSFRVLKNFELQVVHQMVSKTGPDVVVQPTNDLPQGTCTVSEEEILSRMFASKNGSKIKALYNGELSLNKGDWSSADMSLCHHLAFWTGRDSGMMDKIFRSSKLMRDKWDEMRGKNTYGQRTILLAISKCLETYKKFEKKNNEIFWYYETGNKDRKTLKIDNAKLLEFLTNSGHTKYYPKTMQGEPKSTFVYINNRLVSIASKEKLNDEINKHIDNQQNPILPDTSFQKEDLKNLYIKGAPIYLSPDRLQCVKPTEIKFYRDSANDSAIFYSDYWAFIDKNGIIKKPYSELDGYLWDKQKLKRKFPNEIPTDSSGEFAQFVMKACGNSKDTYTSVCTAIGYLLHRYKNPALTKAIVLLDAVISDSPSGRSGKSLILSSLSHIRNIVMMDGKTIDNENDRFAFQNVGADTDIAVMDDIKERFNFESVFHLITGDFGIEKKGKQKEIIPFDESPKIAFTSNYMLNSEGSSFEARVHEIALPSIYNKDFTPEDDFGHKLFIDWDELEWNKFDWFIMECVRYYLNIGLFPHRHANIDERKLRQKTNENFVTFMDDFMDGYTAPKTNDGWEIKKRLYDEYMTISGKHNLKFSMDLFGKWLALYFKYRRINFESAQRRITTDYTVTKESCFKIISKDEK